MQAEIRRLHWVVIHTWNTCAYHTLAMLVHEIVQTKRPPKQCNTTQCNSPKTVIFQRKNELPQVGLNPATFCVLGRYALPHAYMHDLWCFVYRWGRLRTTMMPWPGLIEPFTECLGLGLLGAICIYFLLAVDPLLFLLVHTAVWFTFDLCLLKSIEV